MASITPMSFFTPDASINPDEHTFEITDAQVRSDMQSMQGNIAYNENGATASKDYLTGSYLMRGGVFYKVIQTIAAGGTFDPGDGGNIEHVDIASQFGSGGGGSTGCVEVTQAEYDALSEDSKMADVIYLITDSPDNYLDEIFGDFASVEYTGTASKAYAVGDYLVYDNKFYAVSDAIAQGGTIVTSGNNANVTQTTVGNEITNKILSRVYILDGRETQPQSLNIPNSYRGVLFVSDSVATRCGLYLVSSTTSGSIVMKTINEASDITIDTSTDNKLKFTVSSGQRAILTLNMQNFTTWGG